MLSILTCLLLAAATPSLASEELVLEGTVLAPDGSPAVGARVLVSSRADSPLFFTYIPEVLADETTGADGGFRVTVPASWVRRCDYRPLGLWVWMEGTRLTLISYALEDIPVGEAVTIHLQAPGSDVLVVRDEEGNPVPRARVELAQYRYFFVPPQIAEELSVHTDDEGRAEIGAWIPEQISNLVVETERHGRQRIGGVGGWLAKRELRLKAPGRLRFEVEGTAPALPADARLSLETHSADGNSNDGPTCSGVLALDLAAATAGSEHVLGEGRIYPSLRLSQALAVVPILHGGSIGAGETFALKMKWVAGSRVTGRVVDEETKEPVAGAILWINNSSLRFPVTSGPRGEIEFRALPGGIMVSGIDPPLPFVGTRDRYGSTSAHVVEGEEVSLGDIEVTRGHPIRGRVVDEGGRPVPGAWVFGSQRLQLEQMITTQSVAALADGDGLYSIGASLPAGENVELAARKGTFRTRATVSVSLGTELELVVVENLLLPVAGTVRDEQGQPMVGATVTVWKGREKWPYNPDSEVVIDGSTQLVTDADGNFAGSPCLDPAGSYAFVVQSPESMQHVSKWSTGRELAAGVALVVTRLTILRGRLVGPGGDPRPGVTVRVPTEAGAPAADVTDEDGRFALEGVSSRGGFVFALLGEAGVRGRWFAPSEELAWTIENDAPAWEARARTTPHAAEVALACALVARRVEDARQANDVNTLYSALRGSAWVDPAATLDLLDEVELEEWRVNGVLHEVARSLARSDPDEALAIAATMTVGMSSVLTRVDIVDAMPVADRGRKLELLGLALAEARRVDNPAYRLVSISRVAERLYDLGEEEAAREILDAARSLAADLSPEEWPGYARCCFAEELAVFDLDAALALVEELPDAWDRSRHYGNIALELAGHDPEAAEKVFDRLRRPGGRGGERAARAVCYRMAPVDLERAKRIAAGGYSIGEAYGSMARALADDDRETARELLETAFRKFEAQAAHGISIYVARDNAVVAASLLPLVEKIAPAKLHDYLWRALALRLPPADAQPRPEREPPGMTTDGRLAFFVARYEPELARALVDPIVEVFRERAEQLGDSSDWRGLYAALVEIDPEWAAALARDVLPARAQNCMANVLAREGEERVLFVMEEYLGLWVPGKEDFL